MSEIKVIKAGLLGAGTVGGGVYKLIERRSQEMKHKINAEIEISKILVRDKTKSRPGIPNERMVDHVEEILNDPEISIVIELMGGIEPAKTYIETALKAGKHVVTANKDLLAKHGYELNQLASEHGCDLLFEAAVAGGIPIIRPLRECLEGNEITEIMGIVNGTTNYILTKMTNEGKGYEEALKKAQELGYAEADPTADVKGLDAGRKVAIMASLAFHTKVTFDDVETHGITDITADDIRYARELGYIIKLIGIAKQTGDGIEVGVAPMMLPVSHPLTNVNDSFNAVFVHGDAVDDAMFQGRGAGEFPTASAVVGDIIAAARDMQCGCCGRIRNLYYKEAKLQNKGDAEHKFFLRLLVEDRPGILASIAGVLGNNGVGISQVIQKASVDGVAELVIITDCVKNRYLDDAVTLFNQMSVIKNIASIIRVYG